MSKTKLTEEEKTKLETERLIRMLRTALRLLGFTNREIERRLGYTPSYLTRLFSGQIELRVGHVADIVRAMGMGLAEFFQFAYPLSEEPLSKPAQQLQKMLDELRPPSGHRLPENLTADEVVEIVRQDLPRIVAEAVADANRPKPRKKKAAKASVPKEPAAASKGSGRSQSA